jgi:hypothetical protein
MIDNRGEFCWQTSVEGDEEVYFVLKQESFDPSKTSIITTEKIPSFTYCRSQPGRIQVCQKQSMH